jgi:hypothetical protein
MGARKEVTESFRKDYQRAKRKEKIALLGGIMPTGIS